MEVVVGGGGDTVETYNNHDPDNNVNAKLKQTLSD